MRVNKLILNVLAAFIVLFTMSGCTSLQETLASQMEVPTLENQANRVAIGMTIVRENNIMAYKMPISADASWPAKMAKEVDKKDKKFIEHALKNDPYYATAHYTRYIQRSKLGSGTIMNSFGDLGNVVAIVADQSVSPLTYRAVQKITILFGKDQKYWPDIFSFKNNGGDFLEFKDARMQDIDSPTGDIYENIGEAVISLTPVNMQKSLSDIHLELLDAYDETASLKSEKGDYETELESDKAKKRPELSRSDKKRINNELKVLDFKIKEAESVADEKESIYFQLLDTSVISLESELNIDDENYVKLAKNINIVSNEIQVGATEAYTAFGIAATNIAVNNVLSRLPTELYTLALGKASVPMSLQSKYKQRVKRVAQNALHLLPNIFMGTYYAHKQATLAEKYDEITDLIIVAFETKTQQEKEAAKAAKK